MLRRKGRIIASILAVTLGYSLIMPSVAKATDGMDYKTAFKYSMMFYDANKCGKEVSENNVFDWRGKCHINDGKSLGLDLTGGYHDAGDHVKFGLPQAYSASVLGWALYEFKEGFEKANTTEKELEQLKYFTDYFLKCHYAPDKFVYQVGSGGTDHDYWGPPEKQTDAEGGRENIFIADSNNAASDILGETSAALSIMYLNYKNIDENYANKCLQAAKELYNMGKNKRGLGNSQGFYPSGSYEDDLAWAAAWLYDATDENQYLSEAESFAGNSLDTNWTMCWDNMKVPVSLKLYQLTKNDSTKSSKYKRSIEFNMSQWKNGVATSPGGLKFINGHGSLRYSAAASMIAMLYYQETKDSSLAKLAESQLDYIMGKNPRSMSYIVGFGDKWPVHIHHRAANGYLKNVDDYKNLAPKHVLTGALVGGPDLSDSIVDSLDSYQQTEVATDYNAGLVGALAGYVKYFAEPDPKPDKMLPGDVNNDKEINLADYSLLRKYVTTGGTINITAENADVNEDGEIDFLDLIALKSKL